LAGGWAHPQVSYAVRATPDGALRIAPEMVPERLGEFARGVPIVLGCT
jgi:hypothetical protein